MVDAVERLISRRIQIDKDREDSTRYLLRVVAKTSRHCEDLGVSYVEFKEHDFILRDSLEKNHEFLESLEDLLTLQWGRISLNYEKTEHLLVDDYIDIIVDMRSLSFRLDSQKSGSLVIENKNDGLYICRCMESSVSCDILDCFDINK